MSPNQKLTAGWQESYSSGIAVMDNQHKAILNYLNEFNAVAMSDDRNAISAILLKLIEYTLAHFIDEEIDMYGIGYHEFEKHRKEHDLFLFELRSLYVKFSGSDNNRLVCAEIATTLNEWFLTHISNIDKEYGDYLASRKARQH